MMKYALTAPLTSKTVSNQFKQLAKLIATSSTLMLDLSEVANIDSAGLALLVELKNLAQGKQCKLSFHKSEIVERLCQLYKIIL